MFEADRIAGLGTAVMRRDYVIYFCLSGAFFLFVGLVDMLCSRALQAGVALAWRISLLCALFTGLAGLWGVSVFGISPPLVLLVTAVVALVVLGLSRARFRRDSRCRETPPPAGEPESGAAS